MDHGYGEMGNRLMDACLYEPFDSQRIEELLSSGIDLNMVSECNKDDPYDKYDTMLSEIIENYDFSDDHPDFCEDCEKHDCYGCPHEIPHGLHLSDIVRLFLKHGFDCSAQDGKAGATCLKSLNWSTYDKYILDAAKLLLHAGARPDIAIFDPPENETVLQRVTIKEDLSSINGYIPDSNLFYTLYEIMDAYLKNEPFDEIHFFDCCVGKRIDRILLCSDKSSVTGFFSMDTKAASYEHCFRDQWIIWCEDMPLCINKYTDLIIDPRVPDKMKTQTDVSELFSDCIGSKITGFSFEDINFTKYNTCYHQPVSRIHLDNGKTIRISLNSGEIKRSEVAAYFTII